MAPTVSLEQLVYATRLMNTASSHGIKAAQTLQSWWVESDSAIDPQAFVLRPNIVLELAGEIVAEATPYLQTRRATLASTACLRQANSDGRLNLSNIETRWLDKLSRLADALPVDEDQFIASMVQKVDLSKIRLEEYGIKTR